MGLFFRDKSERRTETRRAVNARGVVVAPGLEAACLIVDVSETGMRIRLERTLTLPTDLVVVEIATGLAHEARVLRRDGVEAGLKRQGQTKLGGLTPSRLAAARDAWVRARGR